MQAIKMFRSELKSFMRSQWCNAAGLQRYETLCALPGTHRGDQGYVHSLLRLPLPPRVRDAHTHAVRACGCGGSASAAAPPLRPAAAAAAATLEPAVCVEKYATLCGVGAEVNEQELVGLGAADPEAGEELFAGLAGAEAGWETNMTLTHVLPDTMPSQAPRVAAREAGGLADLAQLIQTPQFAVRRKSFVHAMFPPVATTA